MKTLNDFKQEVAVENDYQNWSHLNEYETSYAVLDLSDQAAERYAEYKEKEAYEQGYDEGVVNGMTNGMGYKKGWNEGLQWAVNTHCGDFDYAIKQSILTGLKP